MKDIMLAELPVEQRAQILKDSCDKIEERSYLSKYDQEETSLPKNGGEYVRGECYKFIDQEEERVGWYTPDGYLLEERPITQEERQRTVQMEIRRTGTDN